MVFATKNTILAKVEILYHGNSLNRIIFGCNTQVDLKAWHLTWYNICRVLMDGDGYI